MTMMMATYVLVPGFFAVVMAVAFSGGQCGTCANHFARQRRQNTGVLNGVEVRVKSFCRSWFTRAYIPGCRHFRVLLTNGYSVFGNPSQLETFFRRMQTAGRIGAALTCCIVIEFRYYYGITWDSYHMLCLAVMFFVVALHGFAMKVEQTGTIDILYFTDPLSVESSLN